MLTTHLISISYNHKSKVINNISRSPIFQESVQNMIICHLLDSINVIFYQIPLKAKPNKNFIIVYDKLHSSSWRERQLWRFLNILFNIMYIKLKKIEGSVNYFTKNEGRQCVSLKYRHWLHRRVKSLRMWKSVMDVGLWISFHQLLDEAFLMTIRLGISLWI